jgi:hypothetical protein
MPMAFPISENRNWVEWVVGMASLGVIQLVGVSVALNLWRLKAKKTAAPAIQIKPKSTQGTIAAPERLMILDGSAAERSKSAIREIWREVPNH